MDFAEHRREALEAAEAGLREHVLSMRPGGAAVAAFLARLRTPEAVVAWWAEARDRQGGYADAECDAHSRALSTWLIAVLAGDDE